MVKSISVKEMNVSLLTIVQIMDGHSKECAYPDVVKNLVMNLKFMNNSEPVNVLTILIGVKLILNVYQIQNVLTLNSTKEE